MNENLFFALLINISLLYLVAAILTEMRPLRKLLKTRNHTILSKSVLGLIFGLLSMSGTVTGIVYQGAIVNTRVISTLAAGLIGGPMPGVIAGLMGGFFRYIYHPEGFTTLACAIGTFLFGVIGSLSYRRYAKAKNRTITLISLVLGAEIIQALIILTISKPFEAALDLERAIFLPKIVVSSVGLILFMRIISRMYQQFSLEMAEQQHLALYIAQNCLPFLKEGLHDKAAMQKVTDTVRDTLPHFKVLLTNQDEVVAASGFDSSEFEMPTAAREAYQQNKVFVAHESDDLLISEDHAGIAAPLCWESKAVGTLMVILPLGLMPDIEADTRIVEGLGRLFSSMLELRELEREVNLRQQAELRALQSQINPHFLYNALNTISALCLEEPKRAREVILVLSKYFRQTLSINEPFVSLEQELSNVDNYLSLTRTRFEKGVNVALNIDCNIQSCKIPPLILQPIVENAIRHGKSKNLDRDVTINIRKKEDLIQIQVADKGKGFDSIILKQLEDPNVPIFSGLFNVRKRLRNVYGESCQFTIDSSDHGSVVSLCLPANPPVDVLNNRGYYAYSSH